MPDEPTLGELGRLIQAMRVDVRDSMAAMRTDVRDDMAEINARLDKLVSVELYAAERDAMNTRIADLGKGLEQLAARHERDMQAVNTRHEQEMRAIAEQRAQDAARVTNTRRWIVASVLIPTLGLVLPLVLFLLGGSS